MTRKTTITAENPDTATDPDTSKPSLTVVPDPHTAPAVERVNVDPATLLLDLNVRQTTAADKTLVESIRDLGVLQPIVAVRTTDGALRVRYGHRRTLAAIDAGLTTVPVDVVGEETDDQVARIVTQWAENEHRDNLSVTDRIAAVEQLSAFGLSAAQIAKRTKTRRADVDDALTASGSALATKAAQRWEFLDLHHAATLAEFDGDDAATTTLVQAAKSGQFDHTAQRLRDERAHQQAVEAMTVALTEAGVPVVAKPGWNDHDVQRLDQLRDEHGMLDAERHGQCPGHAAYVATVSGWLDADGQPIPEDPQAYDDEDYRDEDDSDDEEPEPGERTWGQYLAPVYVCTQPDQHQPLYGATSGGSGQAKGGMTDEQKAERRLLITRNREWKSAQTVRRDWLRTFVTRKTPPKGTVTFIAAAFARGDWTLEKMLRDGGDLAADLLGTGGHGRRDGLTGALDGASEARATVVLLAQVLGCYEHATTMQTWRNPAGGCAQYLTFLAANGYTLADVERLVTDPDTATA